MQHGAGSVGLQTPCFIQGGMSLSEGSVSLAAGAWGAGNQACAAHTWDLEGDGMGQPAAASCFSFQKTAQPSRGTRR